MFTKRVHTYKKLKTDIRLWQVQGKIKKTDISDIGKTSTSSQ